MILIVGCILAGENEEATSRTVAVEENPPFPDRRPRDDVSARSIVNPADQGLPPELQSLNQACTGDYGEMVERRVIRVLTSFAKGDATRMHAPAASRLAVRLHSARARLGVARVQMAEA